MPDINKYLRFIYNEMLKVPTVYRPWLEIRYWHGVYPDSVSNTCM